MKNTLKKWISTILCMATLSSLALPFSACKDGGVANNHEKHPITIGIDAPTGNFNPFYAETAADKAVVAQTQITMLTIGEDGEPTAEETEATASLDFRQTMKNADGEPTTNGDEAVTTEYDFIIKNEVKFSDGKPMTLHDVLFNLYAYLDPAYDGPIAISTLDIQGLRAYRTQNMALSDSLKPNMEELYRSAAQQRLASLIAYLNGEKTATPIILSDLERAQTILLGEIENAWSMVEGSLESYQDKYRFTEEWELFYFLNDMISYQYEETVNGKKRRIADGKYYTTLDENADGSTAKDVALRTEIETAISDETKIDEAMQSYHCDEERALEFVKRDTAIQTVYNARTIFSEFATLLQTTQTGVEFVEMLVAESQKEDCRDLVAENGGELLVENISGIQVNPEGKARRKFSGGALVEEHDVIRIVLNGVNSEAIGLFTFAIAPMHYYSDKTHTETALADGGFEQSFGVSFNDPVFFNTVLQAPEKTALPVGAGAYMATDEKGNEKVTGDEFFKNGVVYYTRNENFETVDGNLSTPKLNNAKIKYLRYRVVAEDQVLKALTDGLIDAGQPIADRATLETIATDERLVGKGYTGNIYGYVGINPAFVPDMTVRQAIIKAINKNLILDYYSPELAVPVDRSVSINSWAYPLIPDTEDKVGVYEKYTYTRQVKEITDLVESAGWRMGKDGVYEKNGKALCLTFTVNAESNPAYAAFRNATDWLNENCGFDITLVTDVRAEEKRLNGELMVWSAERTFASAPDLYRHYHKNGTASTLNGWGYKAIYADITGLYKDQRAIVDSLSEKIDKAQKTLDEEKRIEYYTEALDKIMELCVELPVYQRNEFTVFNQEKIDASTLNENPTAYCGLFDRIWEVDYE